MVVGFYVLLMVLCLAVSDKAMVSLLENTRTINISSEAARGLTTIDFEIQNLKTEVERLQTAVSTLETQTFPNMQELKQLQTKHRLSLVQMERVSNPDGNFPGVLTYNTVMTGTIGALVRFLKDLESVHVVQTDQVVLRSADEDGSTIALVMPLQVRGQ